MKPAQWRTNKPVFITELHITCPAHRHKWVPSIALAAVRLLGGYKFIWFLYIVQGSNYFNLQKLCDEKYLKEKKKLALSFKTHNATIYATHQRQYNQVPD